MADKQKRTSRVKNAFGPKDRPTPEEAKKAAAKATGKTAGRPKATHGLKRTSVQIDPDLMRRLRVKALMDNRHMYELLAEAIERYLGDE